MSDAPYVGTPKRAPLLRSVRSYTKEEVGAIHTCSELDVNISTSESANKFDCAISCLCNEFIEWFIAFILFYFRYLRSR